MLAEASVLRVFCVREARKSSDGLPGRSMAPRIVRGVPAVPSVHRVSRFDLRFGARDARLRAALAANFRLWCCFDRALSYLTLRIPNFLAKTRHDDDDGPTKNTMDRFAGLVFGRFSSSDDVQGTIGKIFSRRVD